MRIAFLLIPSLTVLLIGACTEGGDAPTDAVWAGSTTGYGSPDGSVNNGSGGTGAVDSGSGDSGGKATGGSLVSACTDSSECNDDNPCTEDSCDSAETCVHQPVSGSCDDGAECTIDDTCTGGECLGTNQCPGEQSCDLGTGSCLACTSDTDCNDNNLCTDDTCTDSVCFYADNTAPCDDEVACTEGDSCSAGQCTAGSLNDLLCDDSESCTDDACTASGCEMTETCGEGWVCESSGGSCIELVCETEKSGSVLWGGHCYWASTGDYDSWDNAKTACSNLGSGWALVVIETEAESDYLATQHVTGFDSIIDPDGLWAIGHRRVAGVWQDLNGGALSSWAAEVLSDGDDACAGLLDELAKSPAGANWTEFPCDWDNARAICEYTP